MRRNATPYMECSTHSLIGEFSAMAKISCGYFHFSMLGRLIIFLATVAPAVHAWGKEGHFAVCKIAQPLLNKEAANAVQKLLPKYAEGDLAEVCSWADEIRFHYPWSAPLHFIDTPDFRCNYDYSRDCHNSEGEKDMCLAGAIYNYTDQLATNRDASPNERYNLTEALLFLSHFMGDIHQPLHVGFTGDKGGNTIIIRWYRQKTNLHHVWDTLLIETALKDFYNSDLMIMIQAIQQNITDNWKTDVPAWEKCGTNELACPNPYAGESISLACKWAYRNAAPGSVLDDDYFLSRLPFVEKQLGKAGVRLATTLNRIFSSEAAQGPYHNYENS